MRNLIAVDIDGVLSDIAAHLVSFANEKFGFNLSSTDLTSENVETCSELSAEQLREIFSTPRFFQTLPVLSLARDSLHQLKKQGWTVILMTDRFWYPEIEIDTRNWLAANDLSFDSLYFVGKTEKAHLARTLCTRVFIEDQLSNANSLAGACETVLLIDRTYNQGSTERSVTRVHDIAEAVSLLSAENDAQSVVHGLEQYTSHLP